MQFRVQNFLIRFYLRFYFKLDTKNSVTPWTLLIQQMRSYSPVSLPLKQTIQTFFFRFNHFVCHALHSHTKFRIILDSEFSCISIKQVKQDLVLYFQLAALDHHLQLSALGHLGEQHGDRAWHDAALGLVERAAHHRLGFTRTSLPLSHHGYVQTFEHVG